MDERHKQVAFLEVESTWKGVDANPAGMCETPCLTRDMFDVPHVFQRLMRIMGIEAISPKRRTTRPAVGHRIYPYLLRNLSIERADKVWSTDITYIPLRHGFLYLVAIMDWYSRYILSWRLSNTLEGSFCLEALDDALSELENHN